MVLSFIEILLAGQEPSLSPSTHKENVPIRVVAVILPTVHLDADPGARVEGCK